MKHCLHFWRFLTFFGVAGAVWLGVGCATAPKPVVRAVSPAASRVILANRSDYAWRIIARPANGGIPIESYLAARASAEMTLPAQTYSVEQTMLLRADIVSSSRYFSFTPEAGQSYRWHLGTLLSLPFGKAGGEEKSTTPSDTIRGKEGGSDHE